MSEQIYAFIKDGIVTNVSVFDNPSEELLNHFKNEFNLDDIVIEQERCSIGGTWDGQIFIQPQPYPSCTLGEDYYWNPPIPVPTDHLERSYTWNESNLSWDMIE